MAEKSESIYWSIGLSHGYMGKREFTHRHGRLYSNLAATLAYRKGYAAGRRLSEEQHKRLFLWMKEEAPN